MAAGTTIAPLQTSNGINANVTLLLALTAGNLAITTVSRIRPTVRLSNMNGAAATVTVKIINVTDTTTIYRESVAKDVAANTSMTFPLPSFLTLANKTYSISVLSSNASDIVVSWQIDWEDVGIAAANVTQWLGTAPLALAAQRVPADATAISGDSTAADNLEAAFDGTGYSFLYQQAAREAHGVSGTVWHVSTGGNDGNDGLSWATAKLTPKTVIEAATAGDLVLIGAGTFAGGAVKITQPANTRVIGAGKDITILTSSIGSNTGYVPGNNAYLADLTIQDIGTAQYAIGSDQDYGDAAFTGAVLERVKSISGYDCFFIDRTSGAVTVTLIDCEMQGTYDGLVVSRCVAGTIIKAERLICHCNSTLYWNAAVRLSGPCLARFNDSDLRGETTASGAYAYGVTVGANSTGQLSNCNISSLGAAGTLDLRQTSSGVLIAVGCEYDRSKTTGTISDISRIVTDTSGNAYADVKLVKTVDADTAISARVDASTLATDLNNLRDMSLNAVTAGTVNDAAATTLSFVTNLTEATNDHYKNRILEFTSGALAGQGREIEAYDGATKTITLYEALTDAPANGVTFKILGYIAP